MASILTWVSTKFAFYRFMWYLFGMIEKIKLWLLRSKYHQPGMIYPGPKTDDETGVTIFHLFLWAFIALGLVFVVAPYLIDLFKR